MVHAFMGLTRATIKANNALKRIEPILKKIEVPWLQTFFKTDASNGYWAANFFLTDAYWLAFLLILGQMCYLRIGLMARGRTYNCERYRHLTNTRPRPRAGVDGHHTKRSCLRLFRWPAVFKTKIINPAYKNIGRAGGMLDIVLWLWKPSATGPLGSCLFEKGWRAKAKLVLVSLYPSSLLRQKRSKQSYNLLPEPPPRCTASQCDSKVGVRHWNGKLSAPREEQGLCYTRTGMTPASGHERLKGDICYGNAIQIPNLNLYAC